MNACRKTKATATSNTSGLKQRILVVDDDSSVRESLAHVLAGENFTVISAANGAEALVVAATTRVDLVLLDLNMPVKGGWDTFERLTAANPVLPVIIITARPNQFFTAANAGVGALLEKPLDFPKLLKTIQDLLVEPNEARLARMVGKPSPFRYLPGRNSTPSQTR
jgi:DNA-binding response OmpR family regulator